MIDPYPRYASCSSGAADGRRAQRARAGGAVLGRRPARPAGLAQAGLDRPDLPRARRARPGARRQGAWLHRRGQGDAARGRARAPAAGGSRVRGGRRARAGRALDVAVLSPDPAAAVRHRRLPAHASALADAARAVPASRGRRRAARARGRRCTSGCSAGGRAGSGRRKGRSRTRWCRSCAAGGLHVDGDRRGDPGADRSGRRFTRTRDGHVEQPERLYRPYRVGRDGAAGRVRVPRSRAVRPDRVHLRVVVGRRGGRRLRPPARRRRAGATARAPAGKRRPSSSSSTARTPGSTTTGRAGRSCGRCTAGSASHPELTDRHDGGGVRRRQRDAAVDLPRLVDQRRLLHLDRPCGRSPGLEPAGRRAPGARRAAGVGVRRRRWRGRARRCSSPKAATGSGGTATTIRRTTTCEFDELFRRHVRNVYRALDQPIPEELFVTNITTAPPAVAHRAADRLHPPGHRRRATRATSNGSAPAAWTPSDTAGRDAPGGGQGGRSSRRSSSASTCEHLYVRVDGDPADAAAASTPGVELRVKFLKPAGAPGRCLRADGERRRGARLERRPATATGRPRECAGLVAAAADDRRAADSRLPASACGTHETGRRSWWRSTRERRRGRASPAARADRSRRCRTGEFPARNWTA